MAKPAHPPFAYPTVQPKGKVTPAAPMVGRHNPDNKLPRKALHVRGRNRGM